MVEPTQTGGNAVKDVGGEGSEPNELRVVS